MRKRTRKQKSAPPDNGWIPLSPEEEEKKIIEMLDAHVPQAKIARRFRRNINSINAINKKRQQSLKPRDKSLASQAFKLFKEEGRNVLDVAIELGIEAPEAEEYRAQYWRLINLDDLYAHYKNLGQKLGEFIDTYNNLISRGITVDQAIDMRNLSSNASELRRAITALSLQKSQLSIGLSQARVHRDELTSQVSNLNSDINNKMAINEQLRHEYNDLNSLLNAIKQGDVIFQKIEQIAKEVGKSVMAFRDEQILTCLIVIIMILKNDPKLVALLTAPGPGLYHPDLQKRVLALITNSWNEILNSVDKHIMNLLFDGVRQVIKDRND